MSSLATSSLDPSFAEALRLLGRVLVASEPYAQDLIVIGGMVPLIYRRASGFGRTAFDPPGTTEVDVSVPPRLAVRDRPMLELLEDADLMVIETPGYRGKPGAQRFQDASKGKDRRLPNYVEFLAPLRGRGEKTLLEAQPGFRVEALRYLDLLAFEPIVLDVAAIPELCVAGPCPLRVPQPVLYVAQKVLSRSSGRLSNPRKATKDLAYVFDVAVLSRPQWALQEALLARATAESPDWRGWLARAGRELHELFGSSTADGTVDAARILRDLMGVRAPSEEEIARVVRRFAEEVFRTRRP
jgi:hypothetical protein